MIAKKNSAQIKIILFLTILQFLYQACSGKDGTGKSFASFQASVTGSSGSPSTGNPNPIPPAGPGPTPSPGPAGSLDGTLDPTCATNKAYNACVFLKNPVSQKNASIPGLSYSTDLSALQIYGVNLTGLNSSGYLENNTIKVQISNGSRAKASAAKDWKFTYKDDAAHKVAQVMAYYWLTLQQEFMTKRSGVMYTKDKHIIVDALNESVSNNAYWDGEENTISMGYFSIASPKTESALSAEIYLHEMGHGNIQYATNDAIKDDANAYGCNCVTEAGCISAINEGQADFHAAMIFPTKTGMGESAFNNLNGIVESGLSRDPNKLKSLTVQTAFEVSGGECHVMGRIYSGVWWEIYKSRTVESEKQDIEKLFSEHLKTLTGSDTFVKAKNKIVTTDKALFAGKYGPLFTAEFKRRGLP